MRVIGKVGDIQIAYQKEKENQDGSKYWGERYTIFFESGDDIHMVDSGWIHCQSKDGGRAILERRGIRVGAIGEALFRYGFREWQGKRFPECELNKFTPMQQGTQQSVATATSEPTAAEVASAMAEAEEAREQHVNLTELPAQEANINPETGLPF